MALKDWLRKKQDSEERDYTADELVALDRYEEAKALLLERLRYYPKDLNAHLKLADVYRHMDDGASCKQEFLYVASAYAADGFYDKARAVFTKVNRIFPGEIDVEMRMEALQRAKRLDYSRDKARAGLLSHGRLEDTATGRMTVEFEQVWDQLLNTSLVDQISSDDFTRLFENVKLRRIPADTVVVEAGPKPEALYIIVKGELDARALDQQGHLITLKSFAPGEIVGDSVLFEHAGWPAQYYCGLDTILLELQREGAEQLIRGHSDPKRLLDVLRAQGNDHATVRAVQHLME